jgi:peptidyl-prolyl cis-trans isomerase D
MLASLRNATRSWYVRGFLILLASTFALFFGSGGSMFSGIGNRPVAEVGRIAIGQSEYADAYFRAYRRISTSFSPDEARAIGLPLQTLRELIAGALLDNAVRDLGVTVPDAEVAALIRSQIGAVSPAVYQDMLRQDGYTVARFEAEVRRDTARWQVLATFAGLPEAPRVLAESLYRHRNERRIVRIATIPPDVAGDIAPPDDPVLAEYYTNNTGLYTAPEFRDLTFITMLPEDVIDTVRVTENELALEYESRLATYTTPATRGLSQLFFSTGENARAARARIDDYELGVPFAQAASGSQQADADVRLGVVTRDVLPAAVADAVFALAEGEISPPLQSEFGWHIYRVDAVVEGTTRNLNDVRAELHDDIALRKSINAMFALSISLDDTLAGGASLEEAAGQVGLTSERVTVDANGLGRDGARPSSLPEFAQFLSVAAQTSEGRESRLIDTPEGGYFVLRVNQVIPRAVRPLDKVAGQVRDDWIAAERGRRVLEFAEEFLALAELAGDLGRATADAGLDSGVTQPFLRTSEGAGGSVSPQLVRNAFALAEGGFTLAPALGLEGGFHVARLIEVVHADPAADAAAVDALQAGLGESFSSDLLRQYEAALQEAISISVDETAYGAALEAATQSLPVPANF